MIEKLLQLSIVSLVPDKLDVLFANFLNVPYSFQLLRFHWRQWSSRLSRTLAKSGEFIRCLDVYWFSEYVIIALVSVQSVFPLRVLQLCFRCLELSGALVSPYIAAKLPITFGMYFRSKHLLKIKP